MSQRCNCTHAHDPETGLAVYPRRSRRTFFRPASDCPQLPPLNFHDGDEEEFFSRNSVRIADYFRSIYYSPISRPKRALTRLYSLADPKINLSVVYEDLPSSPQAAYPIPITKAEYPLKKPTRTTSRWIRLQLWYNLYRKFFTVAILLNLFGIILAASNRWEYARNHAGTFVLGNLQLAILVRNELFGRFLYLVVNTLFAKWPPLWVRLGCTSALQHMGGIHSGCATAGCMWLIFRMTLISFDIGNIPSAILVAGFLTSLAVVISIISALPYVRNRYHNVFEQNHRIAGWFGLFCTWLFVILGDSYDLVTHSWTFSDSQIIRHQDFWFAFLMTILILCPWFTVREVRVHVEIPSSKIAILRFERGMQQGLLARISRGSIWEYHAFGIVSEGVDSPYHYLVCGVQGDFTQGLVDHPPRTVWTRELKFAGVSNTSTLYKRGIRVCTGTGLSASLSTCLQNSDWYLIWMGSDQEKTFGPTISGLVRKLGPDRVTLWDSKQRGGRPDVMKLIKEVYISWQAEVVFITSNWQGNKEMMEGCKEAGIPAFGTLWDF